MKILLDTQCWLWWFLAPKRLNDRAGKLMASRENSLYFSAASSWEICIKVSLGKLRLPLPPAQYIPSMIAGQGVVPLAILHDHTTHISELPFHHTDPFDRLLIAQAQLEDMPILTADPEFKKYDVEVIKAERN